MMVLSSAVESSTVESSTVKAPTDSTTGVVAGAGVALVDLVDLVSIFLGRGAEFFAEVVAGVAVVIFFAIILLVVYLV